MAEASATVEAAVRARFEEAIDARDAGSVARFSALLEVLGDEEHGASCLLAALVAQLRREGERALASVPASVSAPGAAPFPDVLSRALNEGARLVRAHGPTARAHFLAVDGARRLVRTVFAESDAQAAKVLQRYIEGSDLLRRVEVRPFLLPRRGSGDDASPCPPSPPTRRRCAPRCRRARRPRIRRPPPAPLLALGFPSSPAVAATSRRVRSLLPPCPAGLAAGAFPHPTPPSAQTLRHVPRQRRRRRRRTRCCPS